MHIKFDGLAEELTAEQELRKALTQQLVEMNAYIQKLNSFRAPPPFTPEKAPFGEFNLSSSAIAPSPILHINKYMSDTEAPTPTEVKPAKRQMSPEARERMLANLKKGREAEAISAEECGAEGTYNLRPETQAQTIGGRDFRTRTPPALALEKSAKLARARAAGKFLPQVSIPAPNPRARRAPPITQLEQLFRRRCDMATP